MMFFLYFITFINFLFFFSAIFTIFTKSFLIRFKETISISASLIAVLAGLGAFTIYAYENYDQYVDKRDKQYIGIWTNPSEGCIDCIFKNDPEKPIIIDLHVKNGFVSGVLDASGWLDQYYEEQGLKDDYEKGKSIAGIPPEELADKTKRIAQKFIHGYLNIDGRFKFNKGHINIWDFIEGKPVLYAKAEISLAGHMLHFKRVGEGFPGIPQTAEMFKTVNDNGKACKKVASDAPWICIDYKED